MKKNKQRPRIPLRVWQGRRKPKPTLFICVHCGKPIDSAQAVYNQHYHALCLRLIKFQIP